MRKPLLTRIAAVVVAVAVPSCAQVIGLDQFHDGICEPGTTTSDGCPYSGAEGTEGVGTCKAAVRTCNEDGTAWGACKGEVTPKAENCSTPLDENCDGQVNEKESGCCTPGESFSCYDGPTGTEGVGACTAGTQACGDDGKTVGTCSGTVKPSQELCSDTVDNDCDHRECVEWAQIYGDATNQLVQASAVAPDGSTYVAGFFDGVIVLGSTTLTSQGTGDAFLIKLDASGSPVWGKRFGDGLFQEVTALATDTSGTVTIAGRSGSAIDLGGGPLLGGVFLAQFSANGDFVWSRRFADMFGAGGDSAVASLATTAGGDVIAGGHFIDTVDVGDGAVVAKGRDAFIMKINGKTGSAKVSDGGWFLPFGDAADQLVTRVAVTSQGSILALGQFKGQIDFGEGAVSSSAGYDGILIRLDLSGKAQDYHHLVGAGDQQMLDLAVEPTGGIVVAGTTDNAFTDAQTQVASGGFLLKYGPDFSLAWAKSLGSAIPAVAVDDKSNIAVSGLFSGSVELGSDALTVPAGTYAAFLAKLAGNGSLIWQRAFTTTTTDPGSLIGFGGIPRFVQSGELLLMGGLTGTVDFGGLPLTSAGNMDILVAKFGL